MLAGVTLEESRALVTTERPNFSSESPRLAPLSPSTLAPTTDSESTLASWTLARVSRHVVIGAASVHSRFAALAGLVPVPRLSGRAVRFSPGLGSRFTSDSALKRKTYRSFESARRNGDAALSDLYDA